VCVATILGQKINIKGQITDSSKVALIGASAVLLNTEDSVLVTFSLSDDDGNITFRKVENKPYLFSVTYLGYYTYMIPIDPTQSEGDFDIGTIMMAEQASNLDEVTVRADMIPIRINKDTIEYNAAAFRTKPNANVEDLLKQLPGVEVDEEGGITAQGEEVTKVFVDGKEFFGNDPKIATKNLPAIAIDKIKVFDKKSDLAEFTGIDDGSREKSIDLKLKESFKQGYFGTLTAGHGDFGRYEAKGNLNKFNKKTQFSVLLGANNVNEQSFSFTDYMNFSGGMQNMMSGGGRGGFAGSSNFFGDGNNSGYTNSIGSGVNYSVQFTKATKLNLSYFYNHISKDFDQEVFTETYLPTRTTLANALSEQEDKSNGHQFAANFDTKIGEKQSFRLRSSFGVNDNASLGRFADLIEDDRGVLETDALRRNNSNGDNLSYNANAYYRYSINKKGRSLNTDFSISKNDRDMGNLVNSLNQYYTGRVPIIDTINQNTIQATDNVRFGGSLAYSEPLGKKKFVDISYDYRNNDQNVLQDVYDFDPLNTSDREYNFDLSNFYNSIDDYHNFGGNFRASFKYSNLTLGSKYQITKLTGNVESYELPILNEYNTLLPYMTYEYNFSSSKSLSMNYTTSVREPSVTQLQPITDNSNPLRISEGNPDLLPEYRHSLSLRYRSFDQISLRSLFGSFRFSYTKDQIRNTKTITDNNVTITRPDNLGDGYNFSSYISHSGQINDLKIRYNINVNGSMNHGQTILNNIQTESDSYFGSTRLRLENKNKETLDLVLSGRWGYNRTQYSITNDFNSSYWNYNYTFDFGWNINDSWDIRSDFRYSIYNFANSDMTQHVPLWSMEVSKFVLRGNKGQIKLAVVDLLNENTGIRQNVGDNYISDIRTITLGRYVMASFTYALRGFDQGASRSRMGSRYRRH
jgi:hypothetical protein